MICFEIARPRPLPSRLVVGVFRTPEIFPELNILQNVMIPAFAKRDGAFKPNIFGRIVDEKDIRNDAEPVLEDIGLLEFSTREAASLSRGDKRRLELAMCLVQHPKLLLLDEPTAGMSRHDTNRTIEILKKLRNGE
jgi:branched-chain amino acid transport system ATP-binding protein